MIKEKLLLNGYRLYLKLPYQIKSTLKKTYIRKWLIKRNAKFVVHSSVDASVIDFIEKLSAKINKAKAVFYVQPTLLSFQGDAFFCGGAERYALDLHALFSSKGYDFYCVQYSIDEPWIRYYSGLTVIGLPCFSNHELFTYCAKMLMDYAELAISSPFSFLPLVQTKKKIGISHGIYWDTIHSNQDALNIALKFDSFDHIISVDTATLNFIRSLNIRAANKIVYIPNYADHQHFIPNQNNTTDQEITILYPRRLYTPRGFWTVQRIVPQILKEFKNVKFIFCGKGDELEIRAVNTLMKHYAGKVFHIEEQPDLMHKVYAQADIILVPTIHSEGTSLSLIEAMACKKAIISTYVGGLTDLVTNEFNGLMIQPDNSVQLYQAIKRLVLDEPLRKRLATNAYEKSHAFSIRNWQNSWSKVIAETLNISLFESAYSNEPLPNLSLVHFKASGVEFDRMVQRPQQLFKALADLQVKSFFVEDVPGSQHLVINNHLIVAGRDVVMDYSGLVGYVYLATKEALNTHFKTLIYDVLDSPNIHNSTEYYNLHERMLEKADIIVTSSRGLYNEYALKFNKKIVRYIPNAANLSDFSEDKLKIPADLPQNNKKTIGYYGAIAEWFDFALLDKICAYFSECNIVLIGPCREGYKEFQDTTDLTNKYTNLFYFGVKKYNELPEYSTRFDLSIIPFIDNEITENCSPVKLFEYMNVGAPIVCSAMPECRQYQSAMVAENHDEFINKMEHALQLSKTDPYFKIMKEESMQNTWQDRAQQIIDALIEHSMAD